jgi:hypothetical protein
VILFAERFYMSAGVIMIPAGKSLRDSWSIAKDNDLIEYTSMQPITTVALSTSNKLTSYDKVPNFDRLKATRRA